MTLEIQHAGVKGMKWGIRKARLTIGDYVKSSVSSKAREYSFGRKAMNAHKSSYAQLRRDTTRLQLENKLKANSRGISGTLTGKKKVYRNREKLSDANLKRIANRYQLESTLKTEFKKISRSDAKKAKKAIAKAGEIYMKTLVPPVAALPG